MTESSSLGSYITQSSEVNGDLARALEDMFVSFYWGYKSSVEPFSSLFPSLLLQTATTGYMTKMDGVSQPRLQRTLGFRDGSVGDSATDRDRSLPGTS